MGRAASVWRVDPIVPELRRRLIEADYTAEAILERITTLGQSGLERNTTLAAADALGGSTDALAMLIRLFVLQYEVADAPADPLLRALTDAGFVSRTPRGIRASVDLRPYASPDDQATGYLVSDLTPGLDAEPVRTRPDYVLGASPASLTLAQLTPREPVASALDLGTGCGVQSLHLARHSGRVVATDINPRALELAEFGASLSRADIEFRAGSLFDPVADERFDLIVSNPPYVMSPPSDPSQRLVYREAEFFADGLVEAIVRQVPRHLNREGVAMLLTNWAVTQDQPWQERLRGWVDDLGLDCWIVERERLDVYSYIEVWLTDAGLAGTPEWEPAYRRWLDYFATCGITEVGMGWIQLRAAGRSVPDFDIESWPHAVAQPLGELVARRRAAVEAALQPTAALLASRPRLAAVQQEQLGAPGAADPEHIVMRQTTGMLRAMRVDTAQAAILGALDGDLSVAEVLGAVASLLEISAQDLEEQQLPLLRQALREQYLLPHALDPTPGV
ncbi:MAG: methyltransferase [Arachnia sp.]